MDGSAGSATQATLLNRLRVQPTDEAAWEEFVRRYGAQIYRWSSRWGLQEADASDVTQTVLLKVARVISTFEYDPTQRFRGWLKTLAYHAWSDLLRSRRVAVGGSDLLDSLAARDDLAARLEAAYDRELIDIALDRVRLRVKTATWDAFRLTALDGLSGTEASTRLGVSLTNVYKAKSNVQKMLQAEIRRLEGDDS